MLSGGKSLYGAVLALAVFASLSGSPGAEAKSFKVLHTFRSNDGSEPLGNLIRDRHDNLYGTTALGGEFNNGAVFKLAPDGTEQVLYSFSFFDGGSPQAGLVRDAAGNLYGTTEQGSGATCECGSVFKLAADGTETVLHAFGNTDGAYPIASLIRRGGDFYSTTFGGGNESCESGCGVIFRLKTDGGYQVLYSFTGGNDGGNPTSRLITDSAGNFYGTTEYGGDADAGVIFRLSPNGKYRVLYSFTDGADGGEPTGNLIKDRAGNLYGTASGGGISNQNCSRCGTVFKLTPEGTFSVVYSFTGGNDGAFPRGGLVRTRSGKLFGVTEGGGGTQTCVPLGCGTVFRIAADGTETVLHSFTVDDGVNPVTALIDDGRYLYGTAQAGGAGNGTVFIVKK
ncbi:MAG TPA: choice-of-anchor tandem repeat GloVer-containing protein [Rhizomicrobium sp.]|jgi:uncharacterized repeat protein (TIGR03803 family)|nr:choice-of-anchor tandem repeat GloVer-containing protein [Rhizomicrobium sp.]